MAYYIRLSCCLILLMWLLPACQQVRRLTGHRHHKTTATAIANADLVGGTEIDTGRYLLLAYNRYSNVRHRSDNWFSKNVFIKLRRLDDLPLGKIVALPQPAIGISEYTQATWHFDASPAIAGTVTRLATTAAGHCLRLRLRYTDAKGKSGPLLVETVFFRNDPTYFQRHYIDYKGKYDDLRLALKEPAKVKSLDLVTYAIQYAKRNGRDSGPDTLYQRLGELYNLEELNLHLSNLTTLPPSMQQLKRLKKLNLGYNSFTAFPMLVLALDSLTELNLESNRLDSIPAAIAQLRALSVLNLGSNRLRHYPMAVSSISSLRELGLANANLRAVPAQIAQLTQLQALNLDGFWNNPRRNQLLDISVLSHLKQLRALSIRDNGTSLQLLPQLYQLPALEELDMRYSGLDSAQIDRARFPKMKKLLLR